MDPWNNCCQSGYRRSNRPANGNHFGASLVWSCEEMSCLSQKKVLCILFKPDLAIKMQDNLIKREIQCSSEQLVSLVCAAGQNISCKVERSVRNCRGTQTIASKVMLKSIPWYECPGSAYFNHRWFWELEGDLDSYRELSHNKHPLKVGIGDKKSFKKKKKRRNPSKTSVRVLDLWSLLTFLTSRSEI